MEQRPADLSLRRLGSTTRTATDSTDVDRAVERFAASSRRRAAEAAGATCTSNAKRTFNVNGLYQAPYGIELAPTCSAVRAIRRCSSDRDRLWRLGATRASRSAAANRLPAYDKTYGTRTCGSRARSRPHIGNSATMNIRVIGDGVQRVQRQHGAGPATTSRRRRSSLSPRT